MGRTVRTRSAGSARKLPARRARVSSGAMNPPPPDIPTAAAPLRSSPRGAAWLAAAAGVTLAAALPGPPAARAAEPAPRAAAAVARMGAAAAGPILQRLLPASARASADAAQAGALGQALVARAQRVGPPALAEAYRAHPAPVFVGADGLTPAGREALRWLGRADLHGAPHAVRAFAAIQRDALAGAPTLDLSAVSVADDALVRAWRDTRAGAGRGRLASVAALAGAENPALRGVLGRYREGLASWRAEMVSVELQTAQALTILSMELPARPRTDMVHEDARGRYLPPDTLWQEAPSPAPAAGDYAAVLAASAQGPKTLDAYLTGRLPPAPQYAALVQAATRYEALCQGPPWPKVVTPRRSHGAGWDAPEYVRTLETRLKAEGLFDGTPDGVFDARTTTALKRFQAHRTLKPSGNFNKPTARELNVPCTRRLATLKLNIRRWRTTAWTTAKTYVFVNIAAARARYVRDGVLRRAFRVIVGDGRSYWDGSKRRRIYRSATPILTDSITSIIFNPAWVLPKRVILNELLPKLAKDPSYMTEHHYVKRTAANGREMYVQLPNPENALGDVKFNFPNTESVYMHDTNKRGLFRYAKRDHSHGCVRVHKAVDLAREVLVDDRKAAGLRRPVGLTSLARTDRTATFKVHQPIPVYLEYYTAAVEDDGTVSFFRDVYDYDYRALVGPVGRRAPVWPEQLPEAPGR